MDVFVYGTLTDRARAAAVLSAFEFRGDAVLDGLHRVDGEYPTLAPGGTATGRILRTPDVAALDAYEGVENGLYVRVSVPRVGGGPDESDASGRDVALYVGDPGALGVDVEWPGPSSFPAAVERFCREREVAVRPGERDDGQ